jgi:hypothetical protein
MRLLSGEITYGIGDNPPETRRLSTLEHVSPPANECTAQNLVSPVYQTEFVNGIGPTVGCSADSASIWLNLHGLADSRTLVLGTHVLDPAATKLTVEVSQNIGSRLCRMELTTATVTVDVPTASGGAAPYPALVTNDYVRRFAVHVEALSAKEVFGTGCVPTSVTLDMMLEQTAADAVYDPTTPCICE